MKTIEASPDDLIALPEVERLTGIRRSMIYNLMNSGRFPRQIRLSYKVARWQRAEIQSWIADRLRERGSSYKNLIAEAA
jgi:prophage regulatory protein